MLPADTTSSTDVLMGTVVNMIEGVRTEIRNVSSQVGRLSDQVAQVAVTQERRTTALERDSAHLSGRVDDLEATQEAHGRSIGQLFDAEGKQEAATAALSQRRSLSRAQRQWVINILAMLAASGVGVAVTAVVH